MGQGFRHQLPVLENVILHPHVRRVACNNVTIFRALLFVQNCIYIAGFWFGTNCNRYAYSSIVLRKFQTDYLVF